MENVVEQIQQEYANDFYPYQQHKSQNDTVIQFLQESVVNNHQSPLASLAIDWWHDGRH